MIFDKKAKFKLNKENFAIWYHACHTNKIKYTGYRLDNITTIHIKEKYLAKVLYFLEDGTLKNYLQQIGKNEFKW